MKKVIEQKNDINVIVDDESAEKRVLVCSLVGAAYIEEENTREVALAICPELKSELERYVRLLNESLKLIHSLPDLLHDSLGECSEGNDYEIISINGERWINHKVVGSGEPLKQWIKSAIENLLNGSK